MMFIKLFKYSLLSMCLIASLHAMEVKQEAEEECYYAAFSQEDKCKKIFLALTNGNLDEVINWLEHGVDINAKLAFEFTPLLSAAGHEHLEIVKFLLSYRTADGKAVDINAQDWHGNTALMRATSRGFLKIVKLLLSHRSADRKLIVLNAKDDDGYTPLMEAASRGFLEIVQLLLDAFSTDDKAAKELREQLVELQKVQNLNQEILELLQKADKFSSDF